MKQTPAFNETQRYVAGIDLAGHAEHYVCGPRKDDGTHDVASFGMTTPELARMAAWLRARKVESVAMESTSVYWIPVYDTLESAGVKVLLVDTRTVHMVPGRKSDVKDCQWLQKLHSCGLLRGAFRPPEKFNAIRAVVRERENVQHMRTQAIQSIHKALDQMNVLLRLAVSDVDGVTGMRILEAIVNGERDPAALARLRDKRCKRSEGEIAKALTGTWREEHLFNLGESYRTLRFLDERLASYDRQVRDMYGRLSQGFPDPGGPDGDGPGGGRPGGADSDGGEACGGTDGGKAGKACCKAKKDARIKASLARICGGFDMTRIDGIGWESAAAILAEIGPDLRAFPTEKQFVSYVGLAPALGKSAGKNVRMRKKFKNTNRVGQILRMCAFTLIRSESALGARLRCVRSRTCSRTAVKATAREMAKQIYRGLKYGQKYVDVGEEKYLSRRRERTIRSMRKTVQKLGISAAELGIPA